MTIHTEKKDAAVTLHISGRLDTTTAPELETAVNAIPDDVKELTLDMAEVTYISSAGLRVLLGAQKKMSRIGSMKLTGVCEAVMDVLEITGFADILTIEQ